MGVYLRAIFQVSSIILTCFRQGGEGNFIPTQPQNEPLKSPPRLGLRKLSLQSRAGSRTFDTPYTELFSSIISGFQLLTNIIKYKELHFRYVEELQGRISFKRVT